MLKINIILKKVFNLTIIYGIIYKIKGKVVEYMDIGVLLFICSVVVGLLVVIYMWYTF